MGAVGVPEGDTKSGAYLLWLWRWGWVRRYIPYPAVTEGTAGDG